MIFPQIPNSKYISVCIFESKQFVSGSVTSVCIICMYNMSIGRGPYAHLCTQVHGV